MKQTAVIIFRVLGLYIYNILYAADVLANVVIGGDRREPISSRLGKGQLALKPVHSFLAPIVDRVFLTLTGERKHCYNSIKHFEDEYSISSIISRYAA